jgi:hypothetical protein
MLLIAFYLSLYEFYRIEHLKIIIQHFLSAMFLYVDRKYYNLSLVCKRIFT